MSESGRIIRNGRKKYMYDPEKARKPIDTEYEIRYLADGYLRVQKDLESLRKQYLKGKISKELYSAYRNEVLMNR